MSVVRINLVPADLCRAQVRKRHLLRWFSATLVGLGLVAVACAVVGVRAAHADQLESRSKKLQGELQALRTEVRVITAESEEIRMEMERAKALRDKRSWSRMIALVGDTMPASCWLTSLATDPATPTSGTRRRPSLSRARKEDPTPEQITIESPRKLNLKGYAGNPLEPLDFVTHLQNTGVFEDVTLLNSQQQMVQDKVFIQFEIECRW